MSTAARKARKREGIPFERPVQVTTPAQDREANRPRNIVDPSGQLIRFGLTKKAERELKARGLIADGGDAA